MFSARSSTNGVSRFAALIAAVGIAWLQIATTAAQSPNTEQLKMIDRTISVSATGHVSANADLASITTGVQTEADTASAAMARNTAVMTHLIDGLKAQGIDARDVQTTSVHISPRYATPRDNKPAVLNGYIANNQVRILVRDLKRVGEILDSSLTLGATQLGGISFDVSQAETLKDEARTTAMANARRRADLYAKAAGVGVGQVLSISESFENTGPQPMLMGGRARMGSGPVPVEPGSLQLDATVHVTWSLKP